MAQTIHGMCSYSEGRSVALQATGYREIKEGTLRNVRGEEDRSADGEATLV